MLIKFVNIHMLKQSVTYIIFRKKVSRNTNSIPVYNVEVFTSNILKR